MTTSTVAATHAPVNSLPGPHSTGPVGTTYRQYCGRCDGSGTTEDGIQCPKCGGNGLVVNQPSTAPAYVGPRALDARTGDLLVWRSGAYMPAADRDYFPGCKRGLPRLGEAVPARTVAA